MLALGSTGRFPRARGKLQNVWVETWAKHGGSADGLQRAVFSAEPQETANFVCHFVPRDKRVPRLQDAAFLCRLLQFGVNEVPYFLGFCSETFGIIKPFPPPKKDSSGLAFRTTTNGFPSSSLTSTPSSGGRF